MEKAFSTPMFQNFCSRGASEFLYEGKKMPAFFFFFFLAAANSLYPLRFLP